MASDMRWGRVFYLQTRHKPILAGTATHQLIMAIFSHAMGEGFLLAD